MVRMGSPVQVQRGYKALPLRTGSNASDIGSDHQLAETKAP
jgi:hypothetical protein